MRIRDAGKVCDKLWYLGKQESGIYLMEGQKESIVISGGMSYILPAVREQTEHFRIDMTRITKVIILHAHFDHIGIIPYLKRVNASVQVYASSRAWEILHSPKAVRAINDFSRAAEQRLGVEAESIEKDLGWNTDLDGITIGEGDCISLEGMDISIIETPGHSSCSISAYVHELKALFPSDAGGIPFKDLIITSGNANYTEFQRSLEKLFALEVNYLCADHYGYVAGEEAQSHISRAIKAAHETRSRLIDSYARNRDISRAAKEMVLEFHSEHPDYFLASEIDEAVHRQMLKHVTKDMPL